MEHFLNVIFGVSGYFLAKTLDNPDNSKSWKNHKKSIIKIISLVLVLSSIFMPDRIIQNFAYLTYGIYIEVLGRVITFQKYPYPNRYLYSCLYKISTVLGIVSCCSFIYIYFIDINPTWETKIIAFSLGLIAFITEFVRKTLRKIGWI